MIHFRWHLLIATATVMFPVTGFAQQPNVPAIQANASASASANAVAANSVPSLAGGTTQAVPPAGWPPMSATVHAPTVKLDNKEKTAAGLSATWRNRSDRPRLDRDGVLRWVYGNSQTRIVCAPLQICDIELKPGETINNIRMGDTVFWNVTLAFTGGPDGPVTHAAITPLEAGRTTSMLIYTDAHTYSIKLVSTATSYTSRTGFIYPEQQDTLQDQLAAYHNALGGKKNGSTMTLTTSTNNMDLAHLEMLKITGDNPSWRPLAAYTNGQKTYIKFPAAMQFDDSPVLLGINDDGGLFRSPSNRRINYRWMGETMVADSIMSKFELVQGVGGRQQRVTLTRERP